MLKITLKLIVNKGLRCFKKVNMLELEIMGGKKNVYDLYRF